MRVLIAPDSFKGSLESDAVAAAIERGWRRGMPDAETVRLPLADGGEGTLQALVSALDGEIVSQEVSGPLGTPVTAGFGLLPDHGAGRTGVVEMAAASGLHLVDPDPGTAMAASTYGTGELIAAALDRGVTRLVLTLGGSATTDGGVGMAQALGARFRDAQGRELPRGGAALRELAAMDLSGLHPGLAHCEVVAGCDVDNPLHGPTGAAAVFGPQKGADPDAVALLDDGLRRLGAMGVAAGVADPATPGAGAAGGLGFGAVAFLGATLTSGFDLVAEAVALDEALRSADLVITGEGQLDPQSISGKTPVGVVRRASRHGVPVIALAGSVAEGIESLHEEGLTAAFPVVPGPCELPEALTDAAANLARCAEQVARVWRVATG